MPIHIKPRVGLPLDLLIIDIPDCNLFYFTVIRR
jgi:hypothetical protein